MEGETALQILGHEEAQSPPPHYPSTVEMLDQGAFDKIIFPLDELGVVYVRNARLHDKNPFNSVVGADARP